MKCSKVLPIVAKTAERVFLPEVLCLVLEAPACNCVVCRFVVRRYGLSLFIAVFSSLEASFGILDLRLPITL